MSGKRSLRMDTASGEWMTPLVEEAMRFYVFPAIVQHNVPAIASLGVKLGVNNGQELLQALGFPGDTEQAGRELDRWYEAMMAAARMDVTDRQREERPQ